MNVGLPELGVLGIVALLFLGGLKLKGKPKKETKKIASTKRQTDPKASFKNVNTEYSNVSPHEEEASREKESSDSTKA
jgi:hypothetical protein